MRFCPFLAAVVTVWVGVRAWGGEPVPGGPPTSGPRWAADFDGDGDVDLADFQHFQGCFNGPNQPYGWSGCEDADFDRDGDVDLADFGTFQGCFNGPNRVPTCAPISPPAPLPVPVSVESLDVVTGGVFARASGAYLCDFSNMVPYANSARRTRTVLACSASDGRILLNEAGVGASIRPWCRSSTHIFGISSANGNELWRSTDGVAWEKAFTSPAGIIQSVWALNNDRILIFRQLPARRYQPSYSDDAHTAAANGATFTPASGVAFAHHPLYWSLQQAPHGTVVAATYGDWASVVSGVDDDEVYRSVDNGATWTKVLVMTDDVIRHFHAVGYHVATGKWVVDTGDGEGHRFLFVSSDDGVTWASATSGPVNCLPTPHRNAHFESADALDWTASSGAISIARSTDAGDLLSLVSDSGAGKIVATPSVAGGDYVSLAFTVPETVPAGTDLFLQFDYKATYTNNWLIPVIHDGAGELPLSTTFLVSTAGATIPFTAHFTKTGSNDYEVRLKAAAGAAGAGFKVVIDNVRVGCAPSPAGQTTRFRDYGHPTRILCGSDQFKKVFWLDLTDLSYGTLQEVQQSGNGFQQVFFEVFQHAGLWYACGYTPGSGGPWNAMISVSPDLEHWAVYHKFNETFDGVVQFAGFAGGKLHMLVQDTASGYQHFAISPAKASLQTALVLAPTRTNRVSSAISKGTSVWGSFTGATKALDSNAPLVTSDTTAASYRLTGTNAARVCDAAYPVSGLTVGQTYMAHAWVRGRADGVFLQVTGSTDGLSYGLRSGDWTEIWSKPMTATSTTHNLWLGIYPTCHDASFDVWIGALEFAACPAAPWVPGGTTQADEMLAFAIDLPAQFTHVFSVEIMPDASELATAGSSHAYVCSYVGDADNYVELYYDTNDSKFKLASTDGGKPADVIASNVHRFGRATQVKFAVRYDAGGLRLSVADGTGSEHVSGRIHRDGLPIDGPARTIRTGRASDGTSVMPHALFDDSLYGSVLTDSQIESLFGAAISTDVTIP